MVGPTTLRARARTAAAGHAEALRYCLDAGVRVATGADLNPIGPRLRAGTAAARIGWHEPSGGCLRCYRRRQGAQRARRGERAGARLPRGPHLCRGQPNGGSFQALRAKSRCHFRPLCNFIVGPFGLCTAKSGVPVAGPGGPYNSTQALMPYMYMLAFKDFEFGYAAAMASLLALVLFGFSVAEIGILRQDV